MELDNFVDVIAVYTSELDAVRGSYGELIEIFDNDITRLSKRTPAFAEAPFDPKDYPELMEMIGSGDRGETYILFDKADVPAHNLHIYFRWVNLEQHDLIVLVGLSKYAINAEISKTVVNRSYTLLSITAVFLISSVMITVAEKKKGK